MYFDTIWPAEHADSERHQFVNVDGLNVTEDLQIVSNSELDNPIFSFTRGEGELYSIGGTPSAEHATGWIAKLDPADLNLVVLRALDDGEQTWAPSAVIHGDGHIYAVTGHVLYKLNNDLVKLLTFSLPEEYEPESNLLPLSSGKLIVKGGRRLNGRRSTLLVIDEDTFEVLKTVTLPELSRGRFSIYIHDDKEYIYCIGDTTVWRYRYVNPNYLFRDWGWSFPYIEKLCAASFCNSSYGNAPTFVGESLYMMSNTWYSEGASDPICVFRVSLNDAEDYDLLQPFPDTSYGRSLSKMPADPENEILFPLDARNGRLGAFTPQLEELWVREYRTSGIFAGSSPSGEIYINDFVGEGGDRRDWFVALNIFDGTELGRVATPSETRTFAGFAIGYDNVVYYNGGGYVCKVWDSP